MAHLYASNLPPIYRYSVPTRLSEICAWIDARTKSLTWSEKAMLFVSPIAWREEVCVQAAERMIQLHQDYFKVPIEGVIRPFGFMDALELVERAMERSKRKDLIPRFGGGSGEIRVDVLATLESFHKVLVSYMWMHFRRPITYHENEKVEGLKLRVELALDWGLQQLGKRKLQSVSGINSTTNANANISPSVVEHEGNSRLKVEQPPKRVPIHRTNQSESSHSHSPILDSVMDSSTHRFKVEQKPKPKPKISYSSETPRPTRNFSPTPDLTSLLKKYVDSPVLKVGGNSNGIGKR